MVTKRRPQIDLRNRLRAVRIRYFDTGHPVLLISYSVSLSVLVDGVNSLLRNSGTSLTKCVLSRSIRREFFGLLQGLSISQRFWRLSSSGMLRCDFQVSQNLSKIKAPRSFETSVTVISKTRRHIPEDMKFRIMFSESAFVRFDLIKLR